MNTFRRGIKDGIPIGIGYLSVSFTFGILAISYGLNCLEAVLISMMTLTSAGQFAGLSIMCSLGSYIEMVIAQLTINMRYGLMSIALSQKTDDKFCGKYRWLLGTFITDEIFAVASSQKEKVSREYFFGLSIIPYLSWSLGTLFGALLGSVLPDNLTSALGIALYGMFIAIVVPKIREEHKTRIVVLISVILSCIFQYVPRLKSVPIGFSITICALVASIIGAILYPEELQEEQRNESY